MRDAAASSVDIYHIASVFVEILANGDCGGDSPHSARLRGRRCAICG